jgi:hypothetical protein
MIKKNNSAENAESDHQDLEEQEPSNILWHVPNNASASFHRYAGILVLIKNTNTLVAIPMVIRAQLVQQCKCNIVSFVGNNVYVGNCFQIYQLLTVDSSVTEWWNLV